MFFIDLDEESLEITEKVLKSYGVTYTVHTRKNRINRARYYVTYDVQVNIDVEFYDYLQEEIADIVINKKFAEANKQTQLDSLEKCLNAPFAGKNIQTEKQRKEDVVTYQDYQEQIKNNKLKQMDDKKKEQKTYLDNDFASASEMFKNAFGPDNFFSAVIEGDLEQQINSLMRDSNSSGFRITISDSSDRESPDIQISTWDPFNEEE